MRLSKRWLLVTFVLAGLWIALGGTKRFGAAAGLDFLGLLVLVGVALTIGRA